MLSCVQLSATHGLYSPWNSPGQNTERVAIPSPGDLLSPRIKPRTSLVAQTVKRLSTMQETQVQALGWEGEKEMAIHSSTLAWKIPWTEEPGRLQSMGSQRVGYD